MKKNMGSIDKIIRRVIAAVIAALSVTNVLTGTVEIVLLIVAVILALTTLIGFCGLYSLFGINTCKVKEKKQ